MLDFEMMMQMDGLQQTFAFLRNVFPWLTLVILLFTTVSVALAEKRKRALVLKRSAEEERIAGLDLGADEKERLLKAVAPLPEAHEAYPLPDLPLRLVSALAKVFGLMKITLFIGMAYGMARITAMPDPTWNCENPILFFIMTAVFIAFAVAQIVASTKVTRGGNSARRFLIFMAVLDLGSVAFVGMSHELLWRAVIVALSGYSVWALLLRKSAQCAVTRDFKPTRVWQKVAVAVLCLASLLGEPLDFSFKADVNSSFSQVESGCFIGGNGGLPVGRAFLHAGDESEDTLRLMRLIEERLEVPTELVEFGMVPSRAMGLDDLYLMVSKTLDVEKDPPPKPKSDMNPKVLKLIGKENPDIARMFAPQPSGDREIAFEIETPLKRPTFLRAKWRPKTQRIHGSDVRMNLSAEYTGERGEVIQKIGDSAVKTLNQFVAERGEKAVVAALPEPLAAEPDPMPEPTPGFMTNFVRVASAHTPQAVTTLYRSRSFGLDGFDSITNELVTAGWESYGENEYKNPNEYMVIRGPKVFADQYPLSHVYLIHAQCRKLDLPDSYYIDFCKRDFATYMKVFNRRAVPLRVFREALEKYLENPSLSMDELHTAYWKVTNWAAFSRDRPALLYRLATAVRAEPVSEDSFNLFSYLAGQLTVRRVDGNDYHEKSEALFADQITHLDLTAGTNGLDCGQCVLEALEKPRLLMLSKTLNDAAETRVLLPVYFLAWVEAQDDGAYRIHLANSGGGSSFGATEVVKGYQGFHRSYWDGFTGAGAGRGHIPRMDPIEKGRLMLAYEIDPETRVISIQVAFNDNGLTLSSASSGDYMLDQNMFSKEELAAELDRMRQREGGYGLAVVLDKEKRREFKALLKKKSSSIRPLWVQYVEPASRGSEVFD